MFLSVFPSLVGIVVEITDSGNEIVRIRKNISVASN
jgi:hypothetical protein